MKDRIILLIKALNLTAAQFADEIGVQKSSISHIISGRNNASLDFIQKVLSSYPEVNMEWLMFGKGPLFRGTDVIPNSNNDVPSDDVARNEMPPVDLFSELTSGNPKVFRKEIGLTEEVKKDEPLKKVRPEYDSSPVSPIPQNNKTVASQDLKPENEAYRPEHKKSGTKITVKIVEFYSDNTYREYFPE